MRVGDLLAQRFRIERPAGAGAMGSVYRAADLEHADRWVAVKVLPGPRAIPRFEREVAALAGVDHPAVVRYVAHGQAETGDAYLVMEWIEGQSLAERLTVSGLTGVESLALAHRLALGLQALHANGVVHRDLKPSNVMLEGGRVADARIVDLGIARLAREGPDLTSTGTHLGTPRYMAPEQIRDPHEVDGRADVFSLGCVLFECLTGSPAFPGEESVSVLAQVLFGRTPEPSEQRAELPEELDALVERLLTRSRRLRPFATAELADELARWLEGERHERLAQVLARPLQSVAHARPLDPTLAHTLAGETVAGSHERPSLALLGPKARAEREAQVRRTGPPQPSGPWVGRVMELADVCARLERARIVTIWGGAGVGKTRLALEAARAHGRLHPQQVAVYCELGEARASADVLRIVADRAGLPLAAHRDAELVLGGLLGKLGEVLLVLDRCEHLAAELEPLVQLWTEVAPGLCVLATSRAKPRLRGAGGTPVGIELLPLATRDPQQPLLAAAGEQLSEAAELVLARIDDVDSSDPEVREHAERIASALDGNPLAIELAAARVPVLGLAGVVARLPEQLTLLADHSASQTMRGAIAWSWDLLKVPERSALMQCAVFRGSFTLAAAEAVVVAPAGATVLESIEALREQSLVMSSPLASSSTLEVRLQLSTALREFALVQLASARSSDRELAELETRHARYYADLAKARRRAARREHENFVAAAEHLLALGEPHTAATILFALEPTILALGVNSPLVALLERVLAALSTLAAANQALRATRARVRALHGRLLAPAGELALAKEELTRANAEAEAVGDPWLSGVIALELGVAHHFARELDQAAEHYERALDALSEADDVVAEARCHGNLGAVAHDQGRMQDAADGYRQAIALLQDAGEPRLLANFRGNLALLEHEQGRADAARDLYAQAALELEEACDARVLGIVLGNWGTLELAAERGASTLHRDASDPTAYALFARAHALLEGCGDRRSLGLAAARLAVVHALEGRLDDAELHMVRAERQLRRDPLARIVAACLRAFVDLGRALRAAERHDAAGASASMQRARSRYEVAMTAEQAGRPALAQSDDLRLYTALLERELTQASTHLDSVTHTAG